MIHLQQKGTPVGEIAYGLCLAMAQNFLATVIRGRQVVPPLALVGGGAANQGLVRAFAEVLGLDRGITPYLAQSGRWRAQWGRPCRPWSATRSPRCPWADVLPTLALAEARAQVQETIVRLDNGPSPPLAVEPSPAAPLDPLPAEGPVDAYLGVDVGSVSTNLVLLQPGREGL